jgi:hypothetical protein
MSLAITAAAGLAACSVDLGYLDDRTGDRPDGSTDATMAGMADDTSADSPPDVEDAAQGGESDVNIPPVDSAPPTPALLPDAGTFTCPTTIVDSISSTDGTQIGRNNRDPPTTACNTTEPYPGNAADPDMAHFYLAYRFFNPDSSASCVTFTLNYGPTVQDDVDAGDASTQDASTQNDGGNRDASTQNDAGASASSASSSSGVVDDGPSRYVSAYSTFYPTNIPLGFLGYACVGYSQGPTNPPMAMSVTIPAGGTVDVVVTAVDPAPNGPGPYPFSLSCTAQ